MARVVVIHADGIFITGAMSKGEEVPHSVWIVDTSRSRAASIVIDFLVVDTLPELSPILVEEERRTEDTNRFLKEWCWVVLVSTFIKARIPRRMMTPTRVAREDIGFALLLEETAIP
jgi:hypothetical protein